jgi:hypothetical protein
MQTATPEDQQPDAEDGQELEKQQPTAWPQLPPPDRAPDPRRQKSNAQTAH